MIVSFYCEQSNEMQIKRLPKRTVCEAGCRCAVLHSLRMQDSYENSSGAMSLSSIMPLF